MKEGEFTGKVKIDIECVESTDNIVLHSNGLTITNTIVHDSEDKSYIVKKTSYDKVREFFIIELNEELVKDKKYTIELVFNGLLRDKIVGFYTSSYITDTGETK